MIYYFSGTGNSRWAAEYIANATNDKLASIADAMTVGGSQIAERGNDNVVGFVFPVNGWMPPKIVRQFIKHLNIHNAEHCYIYCVMTAGDNIGEAMSVMRKDLNAAGLHLDSAFSLIMPESYVCLPGFNVDDENKKRWKLSQAKRDVEIISEYIIHRRKGIEQLTKGPVPYILTYVLGIPFNKLFISDKPFKVDEERCIRCGKCVETCPVKNINGGKGKLPSWKKDGTCTNCMACYHHCPQHAINHRTTKKKGQYVCPLKIEE
ncbi:MAG: EFR1 family ferrodoxin [Bacteroidaceae bacterium]|nr:EFR1 family ferrodoxin [Bacteroidaceae bacterium]